jgi:hypothetical protein
MMSRHVASLALAVLCTLAGCIDLNGAADKTWICDDGHPCPSGFYCGTDQFCYHGTQPPACNCAVPDDPCQEIPCVDGACGAQRPVADGTAARQQTSGDCKTLVCDGQGHANPVADPTDLPGLSSDPCNDKSCDGVNVVSKAKPGAPCGTGFCNTLGACSDCAPGSVQCSAGGTMDRCGDDGTWVTGITCPFGCIAGACNECKPGTKQCSNGAAQTCGTDGKWGTPTPCPAVCTMGMCADQCSMGATQCVANNTLQTCGTNGKWGGDTKCAHFCDTTLNKCGGVCTPGVDVRCDGNRTEPCGSDGNWGTGTDCVNQACTGNGVCSGICRPTATQCKGTTTVVQTCDKNGAWQDTMTCASICMAGGCTGECTVGDHRCNPTKVDQPQTCITGNWQNDSNPCPHVCSGSGSCTGDCKPPLEKTCMNNDLVPCSANGTWDTASAQHCQFVCSAAQCTGSCKPNTSTCITATSSQACTSTGDPGAITACEFVCNVTTGRCDGECTPGDARCTGTGNLQPQSCSQFGKWNPPRAACAHVCSGGDCGGDCSPSDKRCKPGSTTVPQVCDASGTFVDQPACSVICLSQFGTCGACSPNTRRCSPNSTTLTQICTQNGVWQDDTSCPVVCIASNNMCGSCVPTTSTCAGSQPQKCDANGVYQNNGSACTFGCSGAGVCGTLTAPTPVATVDGSDIVVTWTAPAFANVTCTMERSKDGGAFSHPATSSATCPAGFAQPCNDDLNLLRGRYTYRTTCTGGGQTVSSAATVQISPNLELCATTYTKNTVVVDSVASSSIKTERTISATASNAPFINSWGIASDLATSEIWVTNNDSNVVSVYSRTATDPTALTGSRSFVITLDNVATSLRPVAIALTATEVIVAMRASPYYVAGYPRAFTSSPGTPNVLTPNWYLKGTAAGVNGPASLATDGGNLIFVGNTGSHAVVVYQRNQIAAGLNAGLPANTKTINFGIPITLAVDPVARELFVGDSSGERIDVISADSAAGAPVFKRSIYASGSIDPGLTGLAAIQLDGGLLYALNRDTGIVCVMSNKSDVATGSISITKLLTSDFGNSNGFAICN